MIVIYAEKASLAKLIATALNGGKRIAHPKEPTIGHYEFTFNGQPAVLCHGVCNACPVSKCSFDTFACISVHKEEIYVFSLGIYFLLYKVDE